jgi:aerobic carbon-monoxide dehydrogenase medium subunit
MLQCRTEIRTHGTYDHEPAGLVGHRSRKRINDFRLHQPTTLEEAWRVWSHGGPFCALMAGGVDLINELKNGCHIGDLVALGQLDELKGLRVSADNITLGVLTSHHDLGGADLPAPFDALSKIWRTIANPRVRFKGTLGGNILAANPSYDAAPCLEALGAWTTGRLKDGTIVRLSPCAAASYGKEILLSEIVISRKATAFVYERGERPIASVALAAFGNADQGRSLRIAVGCAFDHTVVVELKLPSGFALIGDTEAKHTLVARLMAALPVARSDVNASGRYRSHLIGILTARAIGKLGGTCL